MKGHPGYFGDDVDFCVELAKTMGSPNFKVLFDIYLVSIMNGDIIRPIPQHHEYIGHYDTAENPERREINEKQDQLPADHPSHHRDGLQRLRGPRIHPHPAGSHLGSPPCGDGV